MNAIQIRLHYAGPVLANLEISVELNGYCAIINLEHPAVALLRFAYNNSQKLIQHEEDIVTTEGKDEIKEDDVNTNQVQSNVLRALEIIQGALADEYPEFIEAIENGLKNFEPELCEEGVNGTYFLKDETGDIKGVFKPEDEEITSENNPKSTEERDQKANSLHGILPGEAVKREVAAYLLDKDGFFGVPRTVLAKVQHHSFNSKDNVKIGSIQEFVENNGASWDVGPNIFPIKEVHKIGILDLYMLNIDRHGGNILIQEQGKSIKLVPIDNGFSLPDSVAIPDLWFEWMNWSQSKKPFDAETLAFIEKLDPESDIKKLYQELAIRPECLRAMRISASLLKKGAAMGMTLYEIGSVLCPKPSSKSKLEEIVDAALCKLNLESFSVISSEEQEQHFFTILSSALDQALFR